MESEHLRLAYRPEGNLLYATDARVEPRRFQVLDGASGAPLWRSEDVEEPVAVTDSLVVAVYTTRVPAESGGYTIKDARLDAYDRRNFTRRWSHDLSAGHHAPWLTSVRSGAHLIFVDGYARLAVLDMDSGAVLKSTGDPGDFDGRIGNLALDGKLLVYLTHRLNTDDFEASRHILHFCTIPDLTEQFAITLQMSEIAGVEFWKDFILTDALYRTACFKRDGRKRWEKPQMNRTPVLDGKFYFTDTDGETTRLCSSDIATGEETILYTEPLP